MLDKNLDLFSLHFCQFQGSTDLFPKRFVPQGPVQSFLGSAVALLSTEEAEKKRQKA